MSATGTETRSPSHQLSLLQALQHAGSAEFDKFNAETAQYTQRALLAAALCFASAATVRFVTAENACKELQLLLGEFVSAGIVLATPQALTAIRVTFAAQHPARAIMADETVTVPVQAPRAPPAVLPDSEVRFKLVRIPGRCRLHWHAQHQVVFTIIDYM